MKAEVETALERRIMNLTEQEPQPAEPSYRLIILTRGLVAAVDSADYDCSVSGSGRPQSAPAPESSMRCANRTDHADRRFGCIG